MSSIGDIIGAGDQVKGYKAARSELKGQKAQYNPFVQGGLEGFDAFQQAILGQDQEGFQNFMQNPNTQYQIQQGLQGVTQGLAGRGALNSGAAMRELQGVGQNIAGQQYQQYLGNLGSLSNYGMNALNAQTGLSGSIADTQIGLGNARATRSQAIGDAGSSMATGFGGGGGFGGMMGGLY